MRYGNVGTLFKLTRKAANLALGRMEMASRAAGWG